ncbi:mobilization protein MobC [Leeuwenhoekiella aequorea]|uniref:Mobilization protein MobC n=2 Tax=Leeuwenhoekiella aequorea TaxID=283736 RepID=A0A4Q0P471_9FLAO|nr:mobilization protein MobC [Leeuwenhoekiella aequorea]
MSVASRGQRVHSVHTFTQPGYSQQKLLIEFQHIKSREMNSNNKSRVVFYLSNQDKELLNNHCNILQVRTSFFVRNCVLEKLGKPILEVSKTNIEVKQYTGELIKIGVNLNQISRKLNSGSKFMIADQKTVLDQISAINNHILQIKSQL